MLEVATWYSHFWAEAHRRQYYSTTPACRSSPAPPACLRVLSPPVSWSETRPRAIAFRMCLGSLRQTHCPGDWPWTGVETKSQVTQHNAPHGSCSRLANSIGTEVYDRTILRHPLPDQAGRNKLTGEMQAWRCNHCSADAETKVRVLHARLGLLGITARKPFQRG